MTAQANAARRWLHEQLQDDFARDVGVSLLLEPRQLPSKYLYDELGTALFQAICQLPWYPIARAEMRLLRRRAAEVFDALAPVGEIIELGGGNGEKLVTLLAHGRTAPSPVVAHLVDISPLALAQASQRVGQLPDVRVVPHESAYEPALDRLAAGGHAAGRRLIAFLSSNIGNFDPVESGALLRRIRAALVPGDGLLLGVDLVKAEHELLLAYDDPLGVTAAFNRNLLVRLNRQLGATFDLDAFAHRAIWDRATSRIEMHLVCRRAHRVEVPALDLTLMMRESEWIWTESSYKYEASEITRLLMQCGFRRRAQWIDVHSRFALTLGEAV